MYRIETTAQISKAGIRFNTNLNLLEEGEYDVVITKRNLKGIADYRAEYFAKRDVLASETGNSKSELHEAIKSYFLPEGHTSTSTLSEEEWREFIRKFKEWSFEYFNVYL